MAVDCLQQPGGSADTLWTLPVTHFFHHSANIIATLHFFMTFFLWLFHFIFLRDPVQYLHRAGRWHWAIPSLHHPSPAGAAGWRRRIRGLWEVQTQRCASGCGSESNRQRKSWCPGPGCSECRSLESKERVWSGQKPKGTFKVKYFYI